MRALLFLLIPTVTTLKMAGVAITSALWYLNVHSAVMTRLLFDATELESFSWYRTRKFSGLL